MKTQHDSPKALLSSLAVPVQVFDLWPPAQTARTMLRLAVATGLFVLIGGASCHKKPDPPIPDTGSQTPPSNDPKVVDVGISQADRQLYYYTPEGSEIYPLGFFRALEIPGSNPPVRFASRLSKYGMVMDKKVQSPWQLPVGITVTKSRDLRFANVDMLGVNCAMCHVSQMEVNGQQYRIDGGPGRVDITSFFTDLFDSSFQTMKNPAAVVRFLGNIWNDEDATFRVELESYMDPDLKDDVAEYFRARPTYAQMQQAGALDREMAKRVQTVCEIEGTKLRKDLAENFLAAPPGSGIERPKSTPFSIGSVDVAPLLEVEAQNAQLHALEGPRRQKVAKAALTSMVTVIRLLGARVAHLKKLATSPKGFFPPGLGRVDAFGNARNLLFPKDAKPLNSPVDLPQIWDLGSHPWLHWDGNTNSVMERNIGQAIGLGAIFESKHFSSTILPRALNKLETVARKMTPPKWPDAFGVIDPEKATKGKQHFIKYCLSCHEKDNLDTSLAEVGTDKNRALSFGAPVQNGTLAFDQAIAPVLTGIRLKAYADHGVTAEEAKKFDHGTAPKWRHTDRYMSRRLRGLWASAPYLHNGSVPTLADLLEPASKRPLNVREGGRKFDPKRVGYFPASKGQVPTRDTLQPGNSNRGHEYGTQMSAGAKAELLEYLKTL